MSPTSLIVFSLVLVAVLAEPKPNAHQAEISPSQAETEGHFKRISRSADEGRFGLIGGTVNLIVTIIYAVISAIKNWIFPPEYQVYPPYG